MDCTCQLLFHRSHQGEQLRIITFDYLQYESNSQYNRRVVKYYTQEESMTNRVITRERGVIPMSSSSSARQYENLPGWPSVVRSMPPGRTSSRLMSASRRARPMTAVARSLLASALK